MSLELGKPARNLIRDQLWSSSQHIRYGDIDELIEEEIFIPLEVQINGGILNLIWAQVREDTKHVRTIR